VNATLENAVLQWEEGHARLLSTSGNPALERRLRRAATAIQAELRKRLGSSFTVAELGDLYRASTDWCLELTLSLSSDDEQTLDPSVTTDAAFYLYMREASDFAGGRVLGLGD
jgi:hypothetical protein